MQSCSYPHVIPVIVVDCRVLQLVDDCLWCNGLIFYPFFNVLHSFSLNIWHMVKFSVVVGSVFMFCRYPFFLFIFCLQLVSITFYLAYIHLLLPFGFRKEFSVHANHLCLVVWITDLWTSESVEPLYVHRLSCYLFGRERRVADIPTDHPSCSKQHAVLQYRWGPY